LGTYEVKILIWWDIFKFHCLIGSLAEALVTWRRSSMVFLSTFMQVPEQYLSYAMTTYFYILSNYSLSSYYTCTTLCCLC
jgi:hypothetical protein